MMPVHLVGISGGRIWHTIRNPGGWDPWDDVTAVAGPLPAGLSEIACGVARGALHVCVTAPNALHHTIRFGRGTWQAWGDAGAAAFSNVNRIVHVDCVGIGDVLHVCVNGTRQIPPPPLIDPKPSVWHASRTTTPDPALDSWTQGAQVTARYLDITDHACGDVGGNVHVLARVVDISGAQLLIHTIRFPDGSLQPTGDQDVFALFPASAPVLRRTGPVAAAGIAGQLHVIASDGVEIHHTIRLNDQAWQDSFGPVRGAVDPTFTTPLTRPACASADGNLHVFALSGSPPARVWHTIRLSNPPAWRNPENANSSFFGDVLAAVPAGPGGSAPAASFVDIAAAGE